MKHKLQLTVAAKRLTLSVLLGLSSLVLLTGITAAWFTNQYRLSSIAKIHTPAYISILAPGDTVIQSIDLSYDKATEVDTDGMVHLKRPFVVRSGSPTFDLCIAHTTNINQLTIQLYEAVATGEGETPYLVGITDRGYSYSWKCNTSNLFKKDYYLNAQDNLTIAQQGQNPAFVQTFGTYTNVQTYAAPLYWVLPNQTGEETINNGEKYYYTNYILELTWRETDKETDILYVIAQAD